MTVYDPPSGWQFGFPKPYKPLPGETLADTLKRDGYPVGVLRMTDAAKYCRFWEHPEDKNEPNT